MRRLLIVAPHPDDELLGCGGTILRHLAAGDEVHWLIVTRMHAEDGFGEDRIAARQTLIEKVAAAVRFTAIHWLDFPAARLDTVPLGDLVAAIGGVVDRSAADTLFIPHGGDVHSDHRVVAQAAGACTKWFRHPNVKRVLAYETLSETDFALPPDGPGMPINYYVDISEQLDRKLELLALYEEELGDFPFPRSLTAVEALAQVRGAAAGCQAAEGFRLLKAVE